MQIEVRRLYLRENFTVGEIYVDGKFFSGSLEDRVRPHGIKVYGETAIPAGTYKTEWRWSKKFGRDTCYLSHVANFDGVTLHGGNKADDSLGCIIVGHRVDPEKGTIPEGASGPAAKLLYAQMLAARKANDLISVIVTEDKVIEDTRERTVTH